MTAQQLAHLLELYTEWLDWMQEDGELPLGLDGLMWAKYCIWVSARVESDIEP